MFNKFKSWMYRFKHSFYYWGMDKDGDLVLRLAWIVFLTKYKEHTIVRLFKNPIIGRAGKWQGYQRADALFLDDERDPPNDGRHWSVVRTSDEAMTWVITNGMPVYMSLDHDLGGDDTAMRFINQLVDYHLSKGGSFPEYTIHSQNPVGVKNLRGLLRSYLTHIDREWRDYER